MSISRVSADKARNVKLMFQILKSKLKFIRALNHINVTQNDFILTYTFIFLI